MRAPLFAIGLLAGCTAFPEVDAAIPADAERRSAPPLLPIAAALAAVPPVSGDPEGESQATSARAAVLSGRANALRSGGSEDTAARLARLRARAAILSRPAPDAAAVDAIAADLAALD